MISHPVKRVLALSVAVEKVILSSVRYKSEAAKVALKPTGISLDDTPRNASKNPETGKATVCLMRGASNDSAYPGKPTVTPTLSSTGTPVTGFRAENTLPAECRVLEFDEIPCPSLIKWASKILGYIPAFSTQVTANLARNGILPVRHLLNQYGPVVRLSGPLGGPILLVARPDLLEAVFAEEGSEPEGIGFDSLRHYRQQKRADSSTSTQSLPFTSPLSSAQTRKALAEATSDVDATLVTGFEATAERFIASVRSARTPQSEANILDILRGWAVESAIYATFGQTLREVDADVDRTLSAFNAASDALRNCETGLQLWRWFLTPSWVKLESALDELHKVLGERVRAEHSKLQREDPVGKPRSILDALLRTGLHPDAATSTIVELLLVAGNTTACAAGMLLYELSRHPRDQRAVLEEIRPFLASPRSKFEDSLPTMTYLHACIKETLRLHPPVPTLSRVLPRAARLHQYHVPEGTVVVLAAAQGARRADQFDDAERFRPHRWIEDDPGRHPLAGVPWGGGARACPAASIAATQVAFLAAKTVRNFQLEHEYGEIRLSGQVLAKPSKPLKLRFVDRTN